jgi:hypothetical protein
MRFAVFGYDRFARHLPSEALTLWPNHKGLKWPERSGAFNPSRVKPARRADYTRFIAERKDFKVIVALLIRDQFKVCLRNDLKIDKSRCWGWEDVKLIQMMPK